MPKITLIKTLNGFKPAYNSDIEIAKKIKLNEPFVYEFSSPRNIKFHRKFFALLNLVYDNQEIYTNIDHLRYDLTIEAGFYTVRHNLHGVEILEPKSISFAKMNDIEFSEFYNAIVDVIIKWLGVDKESIQEQIEQYY